MKTNLIITTAFILAATIGCTSGSNDTKNTEAPAAPAASTAAQKNLEADHIINKAFETGDFSAVRNVIAADAVDHAGETGDIKGVDSIIATMDRMVKSSGSMKTTIIKEFADDEYVMQWMQVSGTMTADGYGMKKGDTFNSQSIEVTKFNSENKATEHWTFMTMADMMKMMGGGK